MTPPQWITKSEWKLPKVMNHFGCVLFGHYLLIFGGGLYDVNVTYQDSIYLLDLMG